MRNLPTIELFTTICIVDADLSSEFKRSFQPRINRNNGHLYYVLDFDIIILFGLTELKAQMAWKENVGDTSLPS